MNRINGINSMDKIKRLQQAMQSAGPGRAALLQDAANRFYLTGMKSSAGTVLVTAEKAWLIIDFRYLEEARRKVRNCIIIEEKQKYAQMRELLAAEGITELCVHAGRTSLAEYRSMEAALPDITLDGSEALARRMDKLRRHKDEEEIGCHRRAQQITDHTFAHICHFIRPGMTELDVAREIGVTLTRLGSEERTFQFIVASGPNSSLPHGFATNRMIQKGDFVTMDFGAVWGGYLADMTRTIAVGSVTQEQRKVYDTVLEAQKRAFDVIRPGVCCRDVDAAARNYIYRQGYRGCFSHGLGHSVGVEVHEDPRFNEVCRDMLTEGTVITVEPGIYLWERFGVRIEDMIVVQEGGFENLTQSPKELIIL